MNLTKEDLLDSKNIHVYQFSIQSDGMSAVDELNFNFSIMQLIEWLFINKVQGNLS